MEAYDTYKDIQSQLGPLEDIFKQAKDQLSRVEEGLDLIKKEKDKTITAAEKKKLEEIRDEAKKAADRVADAQAAQVDANPCLSGLKCTLTPFSQSEKIETEKGTMPQKKGCCPGQTGHHLPPKGYFKNCKKYSKSSALVVCAEGIDQRSGSHGVLHDTQDEIVQGYLDDSGNLSFEGAITASVDAHNRVYTHCDPECIRQQLESSLAECKGTKIHVTDKEGGQFPTKPITPTFGGEG